MTDSIFNTSRLDADRYPIGRYSYSGRFSDSAIAELISEYESLPSRLGSLVRGLSEEQWNRRYRAGGWTVREVVHHLPDSHMNGYIRCMHALAAETPTILPYDESGWVNVAVATRTPVEVSIDLLSSIQARWGVLLRGLSSSERERGYFHPEHQREFSLDEVIGMYAWHGAHHLAHIAAALDR